MFFSHVVLAENAKSNSNTYNTYEHCPVEKTDFKLDSGENVNLPFCADHADFTAVIGMGDMQKTNLALQDMKLHALPVNGQALTMLTFINYTHSPAGPYHEAIFGVFASPTADLFGGLLNLFEYVKWNPLGPTKRHGFAVLKIWVDNNLALKIGNQVWGLGKQMAHFENTPNHFKMNNQSGELVVETRINMAANLPVPYGEYMDFYSFTQAGVWARTQHEGSSELSRWGSQDQMQFGESPEAKYLSNFAMKPLLKSHVPDFGIQVYK